MLDFYLGTAGIDSEPSNHLGGMRAETIHWLQRNQFLKEGSTGHLPDDDPESFPYFDDVILMADQVRAVYEKFMTRLEIVSATPGFKSDAVDRLAKILVTAVEKDAGLSTIAD